jgi:hypothetical protein
VLQIEQFMCLSDNFGVLIHDPDSGLTASHRRSRRGQDRRSRPRQGLDADDIMTTHHHHDHTAGNLALKEMSVAISSGRRARPTRSPASTRCWRGRCVFLWWLRFPGSRRRAIRPAISSIIRPRPGCCLPATRCFPWAAGGCSSAARRIHVAVPEEAEGPAAGDDALLRPRIHALQCPVRTVGRSRQRGAGRARGRGRALRENGRADAAGNAGHRIRDQSVPAARRPGYPRPSRHGRMPSDEAVFAEIRKRKDNF